jgi:hypothetical protein
MAFLSGKNAKACLLGEGARLHALDLDLEAVPGSTVPSPPPYPLADMATLRGNLAKARLREKDRMRGSWATFSRILYNEWRAGLSPKLMARLCFF